ncbi:hypothetical protein [Lichenibacterium ramalinae]|uniref:hypothetical protein n=1 Tax=Lichenibacterium ramalinae TaxID=2316527 RepID=UPI00100E9762|nr:hypothetical protein [Lichenibacterium ramalinae]
MTVFAILLPTTPSPVTDVIKRVFPNDHFEITPTQWLVSAKGTALEIGSKLNIYDANDPTKVHNGIVFTTSSYHGRAPTGVWEWIRDKLEAKVNG